MPMTDAKLVVTVRSGIFTWTRVAAALTAMQPPGLAAGKRVYSAGGVSVQVAQSAAVNDGRLVCAWPITAAATAFKPLARAAAPASAAESAAVWSWRRSL